MAALDTANVSAVSSFVSTLADKVGYYKDLDINPIGFKVNRDRIGKELTSFAWDSLDWDANAIANNPTMGYDYDNIQNWYDSNFSKASVWTRNVAYAKDTFVKHNDLTHLDAWAASNSYTIGDIVKHNNEIYVANVTHKNLASETTLVTSRWDLIRDRVYYTNVAHTSSTQFETDYDAGKWILVQSNLTSAGFARSNTIPSEELAPVTPKENLTITVKTYEGVTGSAPNYTGTGDLSQYKIYYTPYGTVEYLRDKFVDTTLSSTSGTLSTDDHTTLNGAITKVSNSITVTDATKLLPTPKQIVNQVDNTVTNKPGAVWIGTERIEYSKVTGNVLSDIVRGTKGTSIQDHADTTEVYSGYTHIPNAKNKGFWNATGWSLHDDNPSSPKQFT